MQPAIDVKNDIEKFDEKVTFRGKFLFTEQYRKLVALMCQNIYLHAPSKEDLITELDEEKEKKKLAIASKQLFSNNITSKAENQEMKEFNEINYLEDL